MTESSEKKEMKMTSLSKKNCCVYFKRNETFKRESLKK